MSVIPKHNGKRVYETYTSDVAKKWDAIVVGSGMGGMSCASALSKLGRKVLVLEQHYIPGGYTHMFGRKGYKWDVGVHVMGEMTDGEVPYKMLQWLTNGKVKMNTLGDPFDSFHFPHGLNVIMPEGEQKFLDQLYRMFPDEKGKIKRYWKMVSKANVVCKAFFVFQTFPKGLSNILSRILYSFVPNYWNMTTQEVLDKFDFSDDLILALTSHWGYYGSVPKDSSFGIHALTHKHFCNGARFPQGGSSVFASAMLGNVLDAGGEVLTKAEVDEVMVVNGKATGVRMTDGTEIEASVVISATGAKTTVNRMVPDSYKDTEWARKINALEDSPSYLGLNIGFKGDISKEGASSCNKWLYAIQNNDQQLWDITNKDERPHLLYLSFPSLKDPEHDAGNEIKHTAECVTFVDWDAFKKWEDSEFGKRDIDYQDLKQDITDRMLAELNSQLPEIMQHLDFTELSTPLSSKHYTHASRGAIYGLAATPERFGCDELRVRTPIKNLLMCGADIATIGVISAMTSGILAACVVDKRAYLQLL